MTQMKPPPENPGRFRVSLLELNLRNYATLFAKENRYFFQEAHGVFTLAISPSVTVRLKEGGFSAI